MKVTPFKGLLVDQLRTELRSREIYDLAKTKPFLEQDLRRILKGVQRVPSILLTQPLQPLCS